MIGQFAKFVATPFFRKGVEAVTGFFMQDANPAAKAYATKVAGDEAARIPGLLAAAAQAYAVVQTGGVAAFNIASAFNAYNAFNATKGLVFTPWRLYHNYENVKFLNGVKDNGCSFSFNQDKEDADLCIMRPSRPSL